jgi:ribosome recycling factor
MDTAIYEQRFASALAHFVEEIKKIRTGRAYPEMLDGVMVELYGTMMPLNQVASISAPEPQMLLIAPFDPTNIQVISLAISKNQALGLNPSDDGRNIRLPVPPLTEERRRDIVRYLKDKAEEARVSLRTIREDARKAIKLAKETKEISQDDQKRLEKGIDDSIAKANTRIDELTHEKETELMKV